MVNITRQTDADFYYCSNAWTNDGNLKKYSYSKISGNTDGIVGITINGIPLYTGVAENSYDPFFPKAYGGF